MHVAVLPNAPSLSPIAAPDREVLLACVGPGALAAAVVKEAAARARALGAAWIALYVETPDLARLPVRSRERILAVLQLAADSGAETFTLGSVDIARTILEFARSRAVTRIMLGTPTRPAWLRRIAGSLTDTLISQNRGAVIEIVPLAASAHEQPADASGEPGFLGSGNARRSRWPRYALAAALVAAAGAMGSFVHPGPYDASIVMLYLLAAILAGLYLGRGPAIFTAVTGALSFNFLFTDPRFTLHIYQVRDLVNFAALLAVGFIIAQLSARARHQARVAVQREERAVSLGAFTASLLSAHTEREIAQVACDQIGQAFTADVDLWLGSAPGDEPLHLAARARIADVDRGLMQWVHTHATPAGAGTSVQPGEVHYAPVAGADRVIGVLAVRPRVWKLLFLPEPRKALQSYTHQLALALDRMQLLHQKKAAELAIRAEDLRNDLLAGLSHDLRTPLASILGSSSALIERGGELNQASRGELLATIHEESVRMTRLVTNLLEIARLTQGFTKLKREWIPLEEIVGSVRRQLSAQLAHRCVRVTLAPDLPLIFVDGLLFEQLLRNLVENAAKYSPENQPIEITAQPGGESRVVHLSVADRGPGVPDESKQRIFEKFYRAHREEPQSGMGLGLALCKTIVLLHDGVIAVEDRPGGGSLFRVTLPLNEEPPHMDAAIESP